MNSLWLPGDSLLHRAPPGVKLLVLLCLTTALVTLRSPLTVGVVGLVVVLGYAMAGFGPRVLAGQAWPMRWFVVAIAAFQLWVEDARAAVVVAGGLLVAVSAANLVTLTTKVLDLMDTVTRSLRPLRRVVNPEQVALLLALTIRSIPLLSRIVEDAREARAARGQEREWRSFLAAVVIQALHHADRLGEALAARGVDD